MGRFLYMFEVAIMCHIFLHSSTLQVAGELVQAENSLDEIGDGIHPQSLELVGTIEGKTYYVEVEYKMNWEEANSRCKEENLTLGTIETIAQGEFLNQTLSQKYGVDENQSYWLSYVMIEPEHSKMSEKIGHSEDGGMGKENIASSSAIGPLPFYPPSTYTYYGMFSIVARPYEYRVEAKAGELPYYAMCQSLI